MIYVGIDVAKTTHYAAAADSDGVVLVEPFAFDNDAPGFAKFISKIASFPKEQLVLNLPVSIPKTLFVFFLIPVTSLL